MVKYMVIYLVAVHVFLHISVASSDGSYFTKTAFHEFQGSTLSSFGAENILRCCTKCDRLAECLSLNFADQPNNNGLYECVLLRNQATENSKLLLPSQVFHHYVRLTDKCAASRCVNGGTCKSIGFNDYNCLCPPGFMGSNCETKADKWVKVNTSPVCYGSKGNTFGQFYIKESGSVSIVKFVHSSGFVTCNYETKSAQSYWGCGSYSGYKDRMMVVLTDKQNVRILPQDQYLTTPDRLEYSLPGFTPSSPELIFKEFEKPMVVTAGQEYRIWYGHDLKDFLESNNGGNACADVYMYGKF